MNFDWIFYDTRKDYNIEDYDCLLHDKRFYCRRIDFHDTELCIKGTVWQYSTLKSLNVTTDVLLNWNIPLEDIEWYADYLNSKTSRNESNSLICNCTSDQIGSSCQYERPSGRLTIAQTIQDQLARFLQRTNEIFVCLVDEIQCYAGLLCLEWRQICDGIIQCDDGSDEADCYLLEFHQCTADEYQCRNGMCIPLEFLFDATFDCMDASDEQENEKMYELFNKCPIKSAWECDERLCHKNQFSCADGECVHWSNLLHHREGCKNLRDLAYHCETMPPFATLSTGICRKMNNDLLQLPHTSWCEHNLRRLLRGMSRKRALIEIINHCPTLIPYPEQAILAPVIKMFFNKSRIVSFYDFDRQNFHENLPKTSPDVICFNGSLICNGTQTWFDSDHCMDYEEFEALVSYNFFPIHYLFCQAASIANARRATIFQSSSVALWQSDDKHFSSYLCNGSNQVISLRRINDGYADCLFRDDEMNSGKTMIIPYRYRCSTLMPPQFVSYQQLGNQITECMDGSDELSRELNWLFFRCEYEDDYACWMLQNNQANEVQLLFHHHCDSIWDLMDGEDERNCSQWMCTLNMFQCKETGQCISRSWLCDGEFDCNNGEDEHNCSHSNSSWILENQCNKSTEYFCITSNFLSSQTHYRPCIDNSKIGDGTIDCLGGRDERNVLSCSDHQMLGDRFVCDNETKCLVHTAICNGLLDCSDRTDESICFWNRHQCHPGQFACSDGQKCIHRRCDVKQFCSSGEHGFWCPNSIHSMNPYRFNKIRRPSEYNSFCNSYPSKIISSEVVAAPVMTVESKNTLITREFCNRGFFLMTRNGTEPVCFCPPSFYGDRCQFNRRRITVLIRFDRRYRSDLPPILHVLVSLICNRSIIVDYQTFADISQDFPEKHHIYLLYSRPRRRCTYSVRLEAYHSSHFLSFWQYLITPLDFLPVFRLAKILRFPNRTHPWLCAQNRCLNNGTCYVENEYSNQYLCICQRGWHGMHCEERIEQSECSPEALTRGHHSCVCSEGFLLPHCYVQNTVCEQLNACLPHQNCYPLSILPPNKYTCLCQSSKCRKDESFLMLTGNQPNEQSFLVQLLKMSSGYPRLRQQFIIEASAKFPVIQSIYTYDRRKRRDGVVPEIGLLYTFVPQVDFVESVLNILYINCSNELFNLTINLDRQLQQCRSLTHHSIKLYHTYCRDWKYYPCFHSKNYVCYCSALTNRSECISYRQHSISCSHCLNQGICLQGDPRNRSDFTCICPKCVTGRLCQFSSRRFFTISLEMLVEKAHWGLRSLIGPMIFVVIGVLLNGFSLLIFIKPKVRTTDIGLCLFLNSITSQLVLVLLFTRVANLIIARQTITNRSISKVLCQILPYLMTSLNYLSLWLMAFVTVERAIAVAAPIKFRSFRTVTFAAILSLITCFILFGTLYMHIGHYKLIIQPDDSHPFCIQEIPAGDRKFVLYTLLAHQIMPFVVNLLAALLIIIVVARSRATSRQLSPRKTLVREVRRRSELLIGPIICFVTQLPQLIILFIDACDYEKNTWFTHVTLIAYYFSFTPQLSIFFIYILPSPLYKQVLLVETKLGQYFNEMFKILHDTEDISRPH